MTCGVTLAGMLVGGATITGGGASLASGVDVRGTDVALGASVSLYGALVEVVAAHATMRSAALVARIDLYMI